MRPPHSHSRGMMSLFTLPFIRVSVGPGHNQDHDSRMPSPLRALRPAPLIRIPEGEAPSSCS
ncbi:hypothetical protein HMPREF1986_02309 [Oribacterium sp. oral taxon 078 str. F0263]|nr:hypothetical protein HMPREF1986_02309 [Oribacterium sp. oral taxon 078 str. F0263]